MKTMSLSEVKTNLSGLVDEVSRRDEEVLITKNGRPAAVLVSADEYESWQETLAMRADAGLMRDIKKGLLALETHKAKLYTLQKLFRLRGPTVA